MLILVILRPSLDKLAVFEAYEDQVLALLREHGGNLIKRVRGISHDIEAHLIDFPTDESRKAYLADPRRTALAPLWEETGATRESFEVVTL